MYACSLMGSFSEWLQGIGSGIDSGNFLHLEWFQVIYYRSFCVFCVFMCYRINFVFKKIIIVKKWAEQDTRFY